MKNLITILVVLFSTTIMFSQKVKVTEGSFKNVQGISSFNLDFDYSDLMVPKYDSEEEFLADKMKKREEKKPGDGERFRKAWFSDREAKYEPKFIESFNKRWGDGEVKVGMDVGSEYTMKVHTTLMWAGYNVGIVRKNAKIEATISIYKNDDPSKLLVSANYTKVEGGGAMGYDFDAALRIGEGYAKLSKTLAKNIRKGK